MENVNKQLLDALKVARKKLDDEGYFPVEEIDLAIAAAEQAQQAEPARPCWSCSKPVTMSRRAAADGNCPHCGAELDLEDWPPAQQQAEPVARVKIGNHAPLELGSYMRVEGTPSGALKVICTREHAPVANDKRVVQSNRVIDKQLAADGYVNATAAQQLAVPAVLSEPERKFLEFVYRNPGCKCGCAWGDEGPLWPRLEELGLIRAAGSYKWECTPAVSLSIAAQSPAVAVPDEMESVHDTPFMSADTEPEIAYRDGWNACRDAMLAAMEQPK